jgi:hypothetical protein
MKTLTLSLALWFVAAFPLLGQADPLTKDAVMAFINKTDQIIVKKDIAGLEEMISDTAKIFVTVKSGGGAKTSKLTKAQYFNLLNQTWPLAANYNYRRKNLNISMEAGKAVITDEVAESMVIHGQYVSSTTSETATIELVNGKLLITRMESETAMGLR